MATVSLTAAIKEEGDSPKKRHCSGFRFAEQREAPIAWATGGFQEEMRLSSVICWGAWLGCGVPGSPTIRSAVLFEAFLHPHLTEGTFIFPVTLPEKPQHSAKPLYLSRYACSLLQTHRQACRLGATHKHAHTRAHTPSPTV